MARNEWQGGRVVQERPALRPIFALAFGTLAEFEGPETDGVPLAEDTVHYDWITRGLLR